MTGYRSQFSPRIWLGIAVFSSLFAAGAAAQDPAAMRTRMAALEQAQRQYVEEISFWERLINDPDIIFTQTNWAPLPVPMHLSRARSLATEWMMTARFPNGRGGEEIAQSMAAWGQVSEAIKQQLRNQLIPQLNNDLSLVRQEASDLYARLNQPQGPPVPPPTQQQQPPPPSVQPVGEGWRLMQTKTGWDAAPGRDITVLDAKADASGGNITMRYRVGGQCFETWKLSWTFGEDLSFVRQGMRIPLSLSASLIEGDCNTMNPSSVSLAVTPLERFITGEIQQLGSDAVNRIESNVITGEGLQAAARSADPNTVGETSGELVVNGNPHRYPSYYVLRIMAYVPGQFWVAAYIFKAN